jgi:Glucose / Sorbosone dehydrogenase
VVEAAGTIRLVKGGVTQPTPFLDIGAEVLDINEGGCECGLLSMAPAPDYAASGLFYVFYTRDDPTPGSNHYLRIDEYRRSAANPDLADPSSRRIVLEIEHFTASNHNGGQLQFGPDGLLYIAVGDGGNTPELAQSLTTRLGKLLRIDPRGGAPFQYSIPADNPFADGPGGNADEIYAYGLRNPYRFSFDRATGDLTIGDVGGGSWEEVDYMPEGAGRGANFGWPCFEGMHVLSTSGPCSPAPADHSPPVLEYANPSSGAAAVIGGYVIRDSALPAHLGRYVYADTYGAVTGLRTAQLLPGTAVGEGPLGPSVASPVSFGQDACGHIYVASIEGPVVRLEPAAGTFPCKLAPRLTLSTAGAHRAARRGVLTIEVACDEDCAATARGTIRVKGAARRKVRRAARRKAFELRASEAAARLQLGRPTLLQLTLTKRARKRLRRALRARRRAVATITVEASGAGGGTEVQTARARQKKG